MKDDATGADKSKRAKTGNGSNGLILDLSFWTDGANRALESWAQCNSSLFKGAFDLAQEMLAFSQARLQADIDAWKALTACRNPGNLFECQKEFTEKATAQSFDEANKLTSWMIGVMSSATAPFRQEQASKF